MSQEIEQTEETKTREVDNLQWLTKANCKDAAPEDFFVEAGHVISEKTVETCRTCPVREQCLRHAYNKKIESGYFAGMSVGLRKKLTLQEALAYIKQDVPGSKKPGRRKKKSAE